MTDPTDNDDEPESRRQSSQRHKKEAGNRSAKVARSLMTLIPIALENLGLDSELRDAVEKARATKSPSARRREERALAGALRRLDLARVEAMLQREAKSNEDEADTFKSAESWRARLIEEGQPAIEALCGEFAYVDMKRWQKLVEDVQRERAQEQPKGAAKILFRAIRATMRGEKV